jgi:hypothetical protein
MRVTAKQWLLVAMIGSAATAAGLVQAQATAASGDASCPRTRAEVRNECAAFMKTHRWNEQAGDWAPSAAGITWARARS